MYSLWGLAGEHSGVIVLVTETTSSVLLGTYVTKTTKVRNAEPTAESWEIRVEEPWSLVYTQAYNSLLTTEY